MDENEPVFTEVGGDNEVDDLNGLTI